MVKRKGTVLSYVIGSIVVLIALGFLIPMGLFGYIVISDNSKDTSNNHPLNITAQANEYADNLKYQQYSIPIEVSKLNPDKRNQVWISVNADNYSDQDLTDLGKQVLKDYYDKFKFQDSSIIVADTTHSKVMVSYDNGKYDVFKAPSE